MKFAIAFYIKIQIKMIPECYQVCASYFELFIFKVFLCCVVQAVTQETQELGRGCSAYSERKISYS